MLSYHYLALILTALIQITLAGFVFSRGTKRLTNITYALYSASIAHWAFFEALGIVETNPQKALFLWRLNHMGVIFITIFFVHFIISLYPRNEQLKSKKLIFSSYLFGLLFSILNISGILIQEAQPKFYFNFFINANPIYYPFFFLWVAWAVYGLFKLFRLYRISSPTQKRQLRYFSLSMFIAYLGGIPNFLPTFNILIPYLIPFGTYAIALYGFIAVYAIVKYHLLDIRVLALRTFVFVVVYLPILSLPIFVGINFKEDIQRLLHENWWLLPVGLQMILAPVGLIIYSRIKSSAENILMKEQREYQRTLLQVSQGIMLVRDLNKLVKRIVYVVARAIKIKNVALFLLDKESNRYVVKTVRYKGQLDSELSFGHDDMIIQYLAKEKGPLVLEELKARLHGDSIKNRATIEGVERMMEHLKIALIVPSFTQDLIIGFLILGEKANNQPYTQDDLNVFKVLANQAALAIENAVFYEETGKTMAEKFQEHRVWSIGKMGAGIGHQMNNRLNNMKMTAEVLLEDYLPELRKMLPENGNGIMTEVENGLKRISDDAKRGGEVAKILNSFSRKSDKEKLELVPLDIEDAIKGALSLLSCKITVAELNVQIDLPTERPKVLGNLSTLQDVFFNMLDNIHDAYIRKQNAIKEGILPSIGDYKPKTLIRGRINGNHWDVDVEDNGIGMAEDDLKQLFIPFFTKKATSEKGTGLGLGIIKQMIEAHGGTIKVSSNYGEGTKMSFTLQVAK